MADQYRKGYAAFNRGGVISDNPYSVIKDIKRHCAWAAGFNDCAAGHDLDLSIFKFVTDRY